jgi:micrococcal nuclease
VSVKNILLIACLLVCAPIQALELRPDPFIATVVNVADGDTVTVRGSDGKTRRIRLAEIDAPETSQRFGHAAGVFLRGLIEGQELQVIPQTLDQYGRVVAYLAVDGVSVNESIVASGFAWQYKRYSSSKRLSQIEASAREERLGLWMDDNPVPPWEFRKYKKSIDIKTELKSAVDKMRSHFGW